MPKVHLVSDAPADQVLSQRRTGGDNQDFLTLQFQLKATFLGTDEDGPGLSVGGLQSDEGCEAYGGVVVETLQLKGAVGVQRALDLLGAVGLPLGDIGGFETQGVVLVVGGVLFMNGRLVRGLGRIGEKGQVGAETLDDELVESLLFAVCDETPSCMW